jgi:threonine synthase
MLPIPFFRAGVERDSRGSVGVVAALRESKGTAVAASDPQILEAQALTGRLAGIFAEPAAATSVAVAKKLRVKGIIGPDDVVVCNLTGHGLKQPEAIQLSEKEFIPIAPTLDALREQLKSEKL